MNLGNQGNDPDTSSNILFKRKRGRPRKDQSQSPIGIARSLARDQIHEHREYTPVPPGFARSDGNHSNQETLDDHNDDAVVGQTITGVIEATFDAGYLLSVKIGNSEASLRGVVFRAGHYVPVSAENDVAPRLQMVRRNEVPFPPGHHTPVHGSYRRGRGRGRPRSESRFSYSANGSSTGNQLATYSAKDLQIVPVQSSSLISDRGTAVPVVLQPASLSNGASPAVETAPLVSSPAHLTASKVKLVSQTETSQMEKGLGAAPVVEGSLQLKETQNEGTQPSGAFDPVQMQNSSQPLMAEPLRAIHSDPINQSSSVSQNFREARAGKMTELLMAVQENLIEKQATDDVQHHE